MLDAMDIERKVARLESLLAQKCGAKRGGLPRRAQKAARYLNARTQGYIASLEQARQVMGHPKLAQQLDGVALERGYQEAVEQISKVDRKDQRKGFWLGLLGGLVFNLLLALTILLVVLGLRGVLG